MSAGLMREMLLIQQKTTAEDGRGGQIVSWSTLDSVPAERITMGSAERIEAQRMGASVRHRFRIRAHASITPEMRATWRPSWPSGAGMKRLEITGVEPDNDDVGYMLLDCLQHDGQVP